MIVPNNKASLMRPMNLVTFAISLPDGGTFEDYVLALKTARQVQIDSGNVAAAQAMSVVATLAERGKLAFDTDTKPPTIFPS